MSFTTTILQWFRENGRVLPWRETRDAYAIWLSEIILQQTRIEQGRPYWERFMEHMQNKYSPNGYIKLWLPNSPNAKQLNEIRAYIAEPQRLRPIFERLFEEENG